MVAQMRGVIAGDIEEMYALPSPHPAGAPARRAAPHLAAQDARPPDDARRCSSRPIPTPGSCRRTAIPRRRCPRRSAPPRWCSGCAPTTSTRRCSRRRDRGGVRLRAEPRGRAARTGERRRCASSTCTSRTLLKDPVETLRAAYAGMGREFGDAHAERIRALPGATSRRASSARTATRPRTGASPRSACARASRPTSSTSGSRSRSRCGSAPKARGSPQAAAKTRLSSATA